MSSTRPPMLAPNSPSTDLLRTRPDAAPIDNPISLAEPILPEVPNAAVAFAEAQVPSGLPLSVDAFRASLQASAEIGLVTGLNQNGNKGLYGRSSGVQQAVAATTASYMGALGEVIGRVNDAARSADLVNAKFETESYTVDVKKFVAKVDGMVDRYEANAEAYTQAQNIIYDADVTAAKLKDMGVERAIGFESGFALDAIKAQSQSFVSLDRAAKNVQSREIDKRAQIRITEERAVNTRGYTAYDHLRNNQGRAYEAEGISAAELGVTVDAGNAKVSAAKSAAKERKDGAKKVMDSRNAALVLTTGTRITELEYKSLTNYATAQAEQVVTIQALVDKSNKTMEGMSTQFEAEIAKQAELLDDSIKNKTYEYDAMQTVMGLKNTARAQAIQATGVSRNSLNEARIKVISDGMGAINGAKKEVSGNEYQAQLDALGIAERGQESILDIHTANLEAVLSKKTAQAGKTQELMSGVEIDSIQKESTARIKAIGITGDAEADAATKRATAAKEASEKRNSASEAAASQMTAAVISMANVKADAAKTTLEDRYSVDEAVKASDYSVEESVQTLIDAAKLSTIEAQAAFDLQNLIALDDARLLAQGKFTDAEIAVRDREIQAQLAAQQLTLDAHVYALNKHLSAQAYVSAKSLNMHGMLQLNAAITDANTKVQSIMATKYAEMRGAATHYWITAGGQVSRHDLYAYDAPAQ